MAGNVADLELGLREHLQSVTGTRGSAFFARLREPTCKQDDPHDCHNPHLSSPFPTLSARGGRESYQARAYSSSAPATNGSARRTLGSPSLPLVAEQRDL